MSMPLPTRYYQLYYDGRCPLCAREMNVLRKFKRASLLLVDIHQLNQLNDNEREQMLRRLHLQTPDGQWRLGIQANVAAWSFTPIGFLVKPLGWPIWSGIVDRIYQRWADRRYCRAYACTLNAEVRQ